MKIFALNVSAEGNTPESIEYLPEGEHCICCKVNGIAQSINVLVDNKSAETLQASLKALLEEYESGRGPRPFIDFDHENKRAAGFPLEFFWENGVRLKVEWTPAGREAIRNREYNYFSPECRVENGDGVFPRRVEGLSDGAIGALVNNPAFRKIKKISAAGQTPAKQNKEGENMNIEELNAEVSRLKAELEAKEKELQELKNKSESEVSEAKKAKCAAETEVANKEEELKKKDEELKGKDGELKDKDEEIKQVQASRKTLIGELVNSLVQAGKVSASRKDSIIEACYTAKDSGAGILAAFSEVSRGSSPLKTNTASGREGDKLAASRARINEQFNRK